MVIDALKRSLPLPRHEQLKLLTSQPIPKSRTLVSLAEARAIRRIRTR